MPEQKHTPTPWYHNDDGLVSAILEDESVVHVCDCADEPILGAFPVEKSNAAFIVRACNAHEDLVAALERAECRLESIIEFIERHCSGENAIAKRNIVLSIQEECNAALAKAKAVQ